MEKKCIDCKYSRQCVTVKQINPECCLKDRENEKKDEIKEMFKKLGYEIETDLEDLLIYKKEYPLGGTQEFIFHKNNDGMYINNSINGSGTDFLSYKELQAINKQILELGWNNER